MADKIFIDGLSAKAPNSNAPAFIKAKLSIKTSALAAFLIQQNAEWLNIDVKESKGGKWYCELDQWRKEDHASPIQEDTQPPADINPDDIPF